MGITMSQLCFIFHSFCLPQGMPLSLLADASGCLGAQHLELNILQVCLMIKIDPFFQQAIDTAVPSRMSGQRH